MLGCQRLVSLKFPRVEGKHDGFAAQKLKAFVTGTERFATILEKTPFLNGKKQWFCGACETSNVWTRKTWWLCDEKIPSTLFKFYKQASDEPHRVRHDSSSSNKSLGTVATNFRAESWRRQLPSYLRRELNSKQQWQDDKQEELDVESKQVRVSH